MIDPHLAPNAPVIVLGITGRQGRAHTARMRAYGTNVVGGVSPSGRLDEVGGLPVFRTCAEAQATTRAEACVVFVPPDRCADAVVEAAEAGLRLIVSVAEGVPVYDSLRALRRVRALGATWIGSSSPGMAIPGSGIKLGFLPDVALAPGSVGIMSKSGTLSYEVGYRMTRRGLGQSVWVGVGGDPVKGTRFAELVPFFKDDADTRTLVVLGEIGGHEEEELAAALIEHRFQKPVFALLAGGGAREGVAMGHAGAIIHGEHGTLAAKRAALESAGASVCATIQTLADAVISAAT